MLKNYLKIAVRNLVRYKWFSAITILGLTGSTAVFILISLYVRLVANTDAFHENANRLFRLERDQIHNTAGTIGPYLQNRIPEIETTVRFNDCPAQTLLTFNNKTIKYDHFWMADSTFFKVFSFELLKGMPNEVLRNPDQIVLSESAAKRLFGDENPIGKQVLLENKFSLKVSGILKEVPANSSIQIEAVIPFDYHKTIYNNPQILEQFGRWNYQTYILLKPNSNKEKVVAAINKDLADLIEEKFNKRPDEGARFFLTPITDIYFNSYISEDYMLHGKRSNLSIAAIVSVVILLLAIINFINLSTAKATQRAREIGIRKTVGAHKHSLIFQLMLESIAICYLAVILSILLVEQLIPFFSSLVKLPIFFNLLDPINLAIITMGPIVLGFVAGIYPAFYLSSFSAKRILSGEQTKGSKGEAFRKALIVTQFTAAVTLIVFTLHVKSQVSYMCNYNLGFDKNHKIVLELSPELRENKEPFLNELMANPIVESASYHSFPIGNLDEKWGLDYNGEEINLRVMSADTNYINTMGIELLEGRNISSYEPSDSVYEVLINEKAIRTYNLENPVGITIKSWTQKKIRVVGVIRDYHYETLNKELEPQIIINMLWPRFITINYHKGQSKDAIALIETLWQKHSPNFPLSYSEMSDRLERLYQEEARLNRIFQSFTYVAIFIAAIGLFGLAIYSINRRIKEIGIRKVTGASSGQVVTMLVWMFAKMVALSIIIAWPIAWYVTQRWMENFYTPAGHSITLYLLAAGMAMAIAVLTVLFQAINAANTNPATVLKAE